MCWLFGLKSLLRFLFIWRHTLASGLASSLKYSVYLYVITGSLLTLITLHWQAKLPLLEPSTAMEAEATLSPSNGSLTLMALSSNAKLTAYSKGGEQWLALVENQQLSVTFSSRETASFLSLVSVYNTVSLLMLALWLCHLFCYWQRLPDSKNLSTRSSKIAPSLAIQGIMFLFFGLSQLLLNWPLGLNGLLSKPVDVLTPTSLWLYIVVMLILLVPFRYIMANVEQELLTAVQKGSRQQGGKSSLIAYASQSGTAAGIAESIAKLLPQKSDYKIACVSSLHATQLTEYHQVFLLASTYGDGEPPEQAASFISSLQKLEQPLTAVNYSVLALGDRKYPKFCAFGHQLAEMLKQKGAQALLPVAEVDKGHEASIQLWWQQLAQKLGWQDTRVEKSWQTQWTLSNDCLNSSAKRRAAHHIKLSADDCDFSPGDLVEVMPEIDECHLKTKISEQGWLSEERVNFQQQSVSLIEALKQLEWHDEFAESPQLLIEKLPVLTPRTYSIASCQAQQSIDLLVRKVIKDDESIGLCSGYLANIKENQAVKVSIKPHEKFHAPSPDTPIIMIAAGTGLAPFIGFLEQRLRQSSCGKAWLIMGERDEKVDNYLSEKLDYFEHKGCLHKRQHAWSKSSNSEKQKYVGDILFSEQVQIRDWLFNFNAHLYICGNAATLGTSCNKVLEDILGEKKLASLRKQNKIKHDLY